MSHLTCITVVAEAKLVAEAVKVGDPATVSLYQKLTLLEPSITVTEVTLVVPASE